MLVAVYIFVDDVFDCPLYAEPSAGELDEALWTAACEQVGLALEGDGPRRGVITVEEVEIGWLTRVSAGLSFVALASGVRQPDLQTYLRRIAKHYFDEVDDVRYPGPHVEEVIVDVIPPWDGED